MRRDFLMTALALLGVGTMPAERIKPPAEAFELKTAPLRKKDKLTGLVPRTDIPVGLHNGPKRRRGIRSKRIALARARTTTGRDARSESHAEDRK